MVGFFNIETPLATRDRKPGLRQSVPDFGVGAHTRIDGGPVVFWYLPKLSLGAFSAGVGYASGRVLEERFPDPGEVGRGHARPGSARGEGMSYDVRLARKKIREISQRRRR